MFDKPVQLDVTNKDLDLIEAALHTQSKILLLQAGAGGSAARSRLADVKRLLAQLEGKRTGTTRCAGSFFSLPLLRRITG